jgi:hypothetical protein
MLDFDPVEADIELFGDHGGERRRDALSHLGARRYDGDGVVGADLHIGVEGRLISGEIDFQRIRIGFAVVIIADGDAARDGSRADEKRAAGDLSDACQGQIPAVLRTAARLIAARIFG